MERTAREIVDRFKKHAKTPGAMEAMTDILSFMGVPEASMFYEQAVEELENEQMSMDELKAEYVKYIRQGAAFYMSFDAFCRKKEQGEL